MIYGYIAAVSFGGHEQEIYENNNRVLRGLPVHGGMLIRDMFSVTPPSSDNSVTFQTIHFCGSYDQYWRFDEKFLAEYDQLLSRLCWGFSKVIHDYCGHRLEFTASDHNNKDPVMPTKSWTMKHYDSMYANEKEVFGWD
ncbi:hypothetical protein [Hydrogenophaga sp. 5NK40-0174]|uniref:hypothetical protein n=1 Tax=Hydrogenophaga sp. 5NK40-0174 TaxID=3127649 RepID=UPI0033417003